MSAFWGARATRTKWYRHRKEEKINPKVFFEALGITVVMLTAGTLFLSVLLYFFPS